MKNTFFKLMHFSWFILAAFMMSAVKLVSPFHQFSLSIVTQNPLIGRARGKGLGAVFSTWFGLNVVRAYNPSPQQSNTPAQLEQRMRFSLVQSLMSKLLFFVRDGFVAFQDGQTAFNEAMSRNLKNCITGTYPNLAIDNALISLSDGPLIDLGIVEAEESPLHTISGTWSRDTAEGNGSLMDKVTMVVYCEEEKFAIYSDPSCVRQDGQVDVVIPESWASFDKYVHFKAGSELSGTVKSPSQNAGKVPGNV